MGTRGAYGFRIGGLDKITYNHYDSYPSSLGAAIIEFIKDTPDQEILHLAKVIKMVESDDIATEEQIEECGAWADTTVSDGNVEDWYVLLRKSQGCLDAYKKGLRYMIASESMMLDPGYCEYAYIINCDKQLVEFYAPRGSENGRYPAGINLRKEYSFEDIRNKREQVIVEDMDINSES